MLKTLLGLAAASFVAADAAPLAIDGDRTLDAIVHGLPARLRITPGAQSIPAFNPDFTARAGFKPGWIGIGARIGPITVNGRSAVVRFDLGGEQFKRRVTWFAVPVVEGADGMAGPGGIPAPIVRFDLAPPQPGERSVTLPLADFGWSGMGTQISLGEARINVFFDIERAQSTATAAAGAAIAKAQGGTLDGAAGEMLIKLGVKRPVRHLTLATPLPIGQLSLTGLMVRTGDFGSAATIPDADAPAPDPDEVVVTGRKKKKNRLVLEIGRDYLDRCSSIVFDKPAKKLTLTCR